jgi:hypothetical protein
MVSAGLFGTGALSCVHVRRTELHSVLRYSEGLSQVSYKKFRLVRKKLEFSYFCIVLHSLVTALFQSKLFTDSKYTRDFFFGFYTVHYRIYKDRPTNALTCMFLYFSQDGFGGLVVSMLASGFRVRGFKPGRSRWIFNEC